MNSKFIQGKTPYELSKALTGKIKQQRKSFKLSQEKLAKKSGVSLGSIKRFETEYQISLISLIKILIVLELDKEFDELFSNRVYNSIEDVINEQI